MIIDRDAEICYAIGDMGAVNPGCEEFFLEALIDRLGFYLGKGDWVEFLIGVENTADFVASNQCLVELADRWGSEAVKAIGVHEDCLAKLGWIVSIFEPS